MSESVEARINQHLEEENQRLESEVQMLRMLTQNQAAMMEKQSGSTAEIVKYMPQITQLATNMSYIASAVQIVGTNQLTTNSAIQDLTATTERQVSATESMTYVLTRIAEALEGVGDEAWRRNIKAT